MPIITHLIVEERGAFVSKYQGRLRVKKGKEVLCQAPLMHLEQVLVTGKGISLSADVVAACAEAGIPIHFMNLQGKPYASLYAAGLTQTVQTRRAQILAFNDARGVTLGLAFAAGKINNQAALLRYRGKYLKEKEPATFEELRLLALEVTDHLAGLEKLDTGAATIDAIRSQLLGLEGRAAKKYWAGVKLAVAVDESWPGRKGRGAVDPLNSALNYGYGILYGQVERALVLAGLDPYAGFVHVDRPGKPSLVLDLIEEFRQPIVDRTIFAMVNQKSEISLAEDGLLIDESRRRIAERVLDRLDKVEKYEGKKVPLQIIIQSQARHLATYLRGDRACYEPFIVKW